jgi:hypothetical protein
LLGEFRNLVLIVARRPALSSHSCQLPSDLDPVLTERPIAAATSRPDRAISTLLARTRQRIGDWGEDHGRHGVLGMTRADFDRRTGACSPATPARSTVRQIGGPAGQIAARELEIERIRGALRRAEELGVALARRRKRSEPGERHHTCGRPDWRAHG